MRDALLRLFELFVKPILSMNIDRMKVTMVSKWELSWVFVRLILPTNI